MGRHVTPLRHIILILSHPVFALTLGFVNYKKGCTGLAAAMEKVYQLLVHGRRFSLGTLDSSTIKTGCHDIGEILLKVALNTINQIMQSNSVLTETTAHV